MRRGRAARQPFEVVAADGTVLRGFTQGEGPAVVLAHGITAHSDLVVHGSSHLVRAGYRLVSYDARGHGASDPGGPAGYGYGTLADDLEAVCRAETGEGRSVLCGHSMGAHTVLATALRDPDRYAALVVIGPAPGGEGVPPSERALRQWDAMADGLERDGVEGWLRAYEAGGLDPEWRETLMRIAGERIRRHEHPEALAQALREVPRSLPFEGLGALSALQLPVLVVASHDVADPGHPYDVAARIAAALPDARLISEAEGESPLAWQGGRLSREIERFLDEGAIQARLGR